jgi:mRNA-degrading endonuclease RelE of RelBE toxin-antitoxin system
MEFIVEPEAEEDLKKFEEEHQQFILNRLEELEEETTGHEDSDTIRIDGKTVFKFRMKEGVRGGKDFRAVYDIQDGKIKVVAIFHRDRGYRKEELSERF